jgi:hypothetical protein
MDKFEFWQKWLFYVGVIVAGIGVWMTFLTDTQVFREITTQYDKVFWGDNLEAVDIRMRAFQLWVYGAWGGTLAVWGVYIAFLAHYPFKNKEKWVWNCLVYGTGVWFFIETAISVRFSVMPNIIINVLIFSAIIWPCIMSKSYFEAEAPESGAKKKGSKAR